MTDASYFAAKAARCRELLGVAIAPEVRQQLRLWADEFEFMAEAFNAHRIIGDHHANPQPQADQQIISGSLKAPLMDETGQ